MILSEILKELSKFNDSDFELSSGSNQEDITELERKLKHSLPEDFKEFLLISNGASINCQDLFGINPETPANDLYRNYLFEKDEVENPIREYLLPIYPDGAGNHNCLDLKTLSADGKTCNVIFWQHDWFYSDSDQPDIDATSFTEFLEILLNNMLKYYNYDGSDKI